MRNPANTYYSEGQDIRFTVPTPEEERALWVKAKDEGCEKSKEFLIRNHLLFAMMQAENMVAGRLPRNEMTSAANYAVMKAYNKFDYKRGFRFTTYLRPFIRGEISSLWRSKFSGGVPDPSIGGALGGRFGFDNKSVNGVHDTSEESGGSKDAQYNPTVPCENHQAEALDLARFNGAALVKAMKVLNKKDQALIRSIYVHGKCMADVARQRKLTREAVRLMHLKIMAKLKRALKKEGVTSAQ